MEKLHSRCKKRTGEKHLTNEGYWVIITEYITAKDCTIQFEDGVVLYNKYYLDIKKGLIRNPNRISMCGKGYVGEGKYKAIRKVKSYSTWANMLQRCYSKTYHAKKPTYIECYVTEEWLNFQNFAEWFEKNYNPEIMERWSLDKDILVKGNKVYSPETCCFVPYEINNKFTSRCTTKNYKEVADKYKNQITQRTYQALIDRDEC